MMLHIKNYKFCLDIWGIVLFFIIMIPNFIWFAIPAGNDLLRSESITQIIDVIGSIFQVIMVTALCIIENKQYEKPMKKTVLVGITIAVILYYIGWCAYYFQIVNAVTILTLCIAPCIAFIMFSVIKKNLVALKPSVKFEGAAISSTPEIIEAHR